MDRKTLGNLAIFILVLVALNFFFGLHISIVGSLLLTLGLSFLFNRWR